MADQSAVFVASPEALVTRGGMVTEVAVEVVERGRSPQWVRVKVPVETVPEPSVGLLLLGPLVVFLIRRRR